MIVGTDLMAAWELKIDSQAGEIQCKEAAKKSRDATPETAFHIEDTDPILTHQKVEISIYQDLENRKDSNHGFYRLSYPKIHGISLTSHTGSNLDRICKTRKKLQI